MDAQAPPLPGDERRRATETTAAFIYQWWHTVLAWLELKDEELLYVESAEDFEVVTPTSGAATQVKAGTSARFTLRSPAVVDALNHFWTMRHADKRDIHFALIGRTEIGVEDDAPFGDGVAGLHRWTEAANTRDEGWASACRDFLRSDSRVRNRLCPKLAQFLADASPAAVLENLLRRVTFDLGRSDEETIPRLVEDRVIALADRRHGATAVEALRVPPQLFMRVLDHAKAKERLPLTRGALLKMIEDQTIKQREAIRYAMRPPPWAAAPEAGVTANIDWMDSYPEFDLPVLPVDVSPREGAVAAIVRLLANVPIVVVHGSTGMGKSTLAKLAAKGALEKWRWLDVADCRGGSLVLRVRYLLGVLDRTQDSSFNVVIDGLDVDELNAGARHTVAGLLFLLRRRGGQIILTTQRAITAAEAAACGFGPFESYSAPVLEAAEVEGLAKSMGCPPKALDLWVAWVLLQSQGHPQLVHAALLGLQRLQWPEPSLDALKQSSESVDDERGRYRRLVSRLTADEREMIARLQPMNGTFRRDHVIALAEKLERIQGASFLFDRLVGPWIEPAGIRDYFRLSPLLTGQGKSDISDNRVRCVHTAIAIAKLQCGPVYPADAANALEHALAAENGAVGGPILARLLCTDPEHRSMVFRHLAWIIWIRRSPASPLFRDFPHLDLLFQQLQWQVAIEVDPKAVPELVRACDESMVILPTEIPRSSFRHVFLVDVLLHASHLVPVHQSLAYWLELGALLTDHPELADIDTAIADTLPPHTKTWPAPRRCALAMLQIILTREAQAGRVAEFVAAIDSLSSDARRALEEMWSACPTALVLVCDQVWMEERTKDNPQWRSIIQFFETVRERAVRWNAHAFEAAAVRAQAIVCDEYLNDLAAAWDCLKKAGPLEPACRSVLLDQESKLHVRGNDHQRALEALREAFLMWDSSVVGEDHKLYALQRAGTSAGHLGFWSEAAEYFEAASRIAGSNDQMLMVAGLTADAAYARWQTRDKAESLRLFVLALDICAALPNPESDLASRQVQKVVGHMLSHLCWSRRRFPSEPKLAPVVPGMASDPIVREGVKELPPPRPDMCKMMLATLEHDYRLGHRCWNQFSAELRSDGHLTTRHFTVELACRKAVLHGEVADLPKLAQEIVVVFEQIRHLNKRSAVVGPDRLWAEDRIEPSKFITDEDAFLAHPGGEQLFLCALVVLALTGGTMATALESWKSQLGESPFPNSLRSLIQTVEQVAGLSDTERYDRSRRGGTAQERVGASAQLLGHARLPPNVLWATGYTLLVHLADNYWGGDARLLLDDEMARRWRTACEDRFALRNPTLFVPDILAACEAPEKDGRRSAKILRAAIPTISLQLDAGIVETLRALEAGTYSSGMGTLAPRPASN